MRSALRHPPAFSVTLNPDPAWRALGCVLSGLAVAGLVATLLQHLTPALAAPACAATLLLAAAAAAWLARALGCRDYRYRLRWDGQAWWLASGQQPELPVRLSVAMDLDHWLLLRAQRPGWRLAWRPLYLPLAEAAAQAHWPELRAALFAASQA